MNPVIENIKSRRTTRSFSPKPVPEELLAQVLEAAQWAPSGTNRQPWFFSVIRNPSLLQELNRETKRVILSSENPHFRKMGENTDLHLFYGAPCLIIVSWKGGAVTPVMDISAATQNLLLSAHSLGLGTCWNGLLTYLFESEPGNPVIAKCAIPAGYHPSHGVALGYSQKKQGMPPVRKGPFVAYVD